MRSEWIGTDYYAVLGVARDATEQQIRAAYRAKARVLHPDAGGTSEAFARIATAYAVLGSPARRTEYDLTLPPESGNLLDLPLFGRRFDAFG